MKKLLLTRYKTIIKCLAISSLVYSPFWLYQKTRILEAQKEAAWEATNSPEEVATLREISKHPFTFLGYGSQCFCFLSHDEKYVLKLCRHSRYNKPFSKKGPAKKQADFLSYRLAYEVIPEESQVTLLHLSATDDINATFQLIDPLGFSHSFDADKVAFYVQKKAIPLDEYLKDISHEESKVLAKRLLLLFKTCCEKGIQIKDIYPKNIGINQDGLLWIDPGRIIEKASFQEQKRQNKALYRFKTLLSPLIDQRFESDLAQELSAITAK